MKRAVAVIALLLVLVAPTVALAQAAESPAKAGAAVKFTGPEKAQIISWVGLAVAVTTALSIIGAGYAVAHAGSAAIGATSEKPEMMARSLVFVALGEGLAVFGLVVAFLLLFMVVMPVLNQ
jgi:V/A-type H+-transporting ATPase subunit K